MKLLTINSKTYIYKLTRVFMLVDTGYCMIYDVTIITSIIRFNKDATIKFTVIKKSLSFLVH